jgi:hypothetical protein
MHLSDVQLRDSSEYCELRAAVHSRMLAEPFPLWFRFPRDLRPHLNVENGNPFIPALLVLAMRAGESLTIPLPVSRRLQAAISEIQRVYRSFDASLFEITVDAPPAPGTRPAEARERSTALFLSLGVDSLFSLLRNARDHPDDQATIAALIHVHGFDIRFGDGIGPVLAAVRANCGTIADQLGKRFIPASTNLRDLMDRFVDWSLLAHGAAMASLGLVLEGYLRQVHIAAGLGQGARQPCGSHPALDPLWSTERQDVIYNGWEADRYSKTAFIAQYPIATEILRVCYQDASSTYNCGRCWKCLSTMIHLQIAGALARCTSLPAQLNLEAVRRVELEPEHTARSLQALLAEVRQWGGNPELEAILERRADALAAQGPADAEEIELLQVRVERLAPLQTELTRLRGELDRQSLWAQRAVRDVEQRDATIRDLQAQVAELTAWAQRAAREVAERDTQILALQARLSELESIPLTAPAPGVQQDGAARGALGQRAKSWLANRARGK